MHILRPVAVEEIYMKILSKQVIETLNIIKSNT